MKVYGAYFFKTYDPVMTEVLDLAGQKSDTWVEKNGGPTASCIRAWRKRKTRRPQNASVEAAGRALGFKRVWVKDKP